MFTKAKLSFRNKVIFESDFRANIDKAFCVVAKMLFNNRINVDGSIDVNQAGFLRKYELWSYIYYLYYYNNSVISEFVSMKNPDNGKASAVRFYETVVSVVDNPYVKPGDISPLDVNTLAFFVNSMVKKYGMDMMNPVVVYLQQLLKNTEAIDKLKTFTLVTGRPPNEVEVINDPGKLSSANVVVRVVEKTT